MNTLTDSRAVCIHIWHCRLILLAAKITSLYEKEVLILSFNGMSLLPVNVSHITHH